MAKAAINIIIICIFVSANILVAQNIRSPMNAKKIKIHSEDYSILIAGHLYGAPNNSRSVFPSASILAMLYEINSMDCSFFVSLGDNFRTADDIQIINYKKSFANQLNFPIFNAVGNHDVKDRKKYVNTFGKTYYEFVYGSELYIFLDSELNHPGIMGDQLNYFINVIKQKAVNPNIKNVFIFSHKLIWAVNIPKYQVVYNHLNSQSGYGLDDKFNSIIIPILKDLGQKDKNVFWISGDIGCSWSLPLFYDKDNNTDITFIATGLGDTEKDLILKVNINHGDVNFLPLSLGAEDINITHYDLRYWDKYFTGSQSFQYSSTCFSEIQRMLLHKYYWVGFFSLFPVVLLIYYIKRRQ